MAEQWTEEGIDELCSEAAFEGYNQGFTRCLALVAWAAAKAGVSKRRADRMARLLERGPKNEAELLDPWEGRADG